jgi:hypothetical protein
VGRSIDTLMRPALIQRALFIVLAGTILYAAPTPVRAAEIGAIMMGGAAFFNSNDVDRVAEELDFGSLSPGIDGGVFLQIGPPRRGLSTLAGVSVFWSRRKHPDDFVNDSGERMPGEGAFRLTSIGFPVTLVCSIPRGRARFYAGGGVGYYAATVTAESDLTGSSWFPSDGSTNDGSRSADGAGVHFLAGYEHPTSIGGIGAGVLLRHARFQTDSVSGASDFDVDLSGVSVFLSLSIYPARSGASATTGASAGAGAGATP